MCLDHASLWHAILITSFVIGSAREALFILLEPLILGSHGLLYTDAARAWLTGGNPWQVGPPAAVFAGPPPMLLPFALLTPLPTDATRWISVIGTAGLAVWSIRRLDLPAYWLLFPPISGSILLGHPEVLMLALLVAGGALSGLAAVIKPYAGLALLAEQRWRAILVAFAVVAMTVPLLPWARFIEELPTIAASLARQAQGESTGNPVLMAIGALALIRLGLRRGLWLTTPVLWPYAQGGYKVGTVPALSPLIAAVWALPFPGATLIGIVAEAVALEVGRRRSLPRFLELGIAASDQPATDGSAAVPDTSPVRAGSR